MYAWLAPLTFVILTHILDSVEVDGLYPVFIVHLFYRKWLSKTSLIYWYNIPPHINLPLCVMASIKVFSSGQKITASDKRRTRRKIITITKLQIIFGLHWFLLYFFTGYASGACPNFATRHVFEKSQAVFTKEKWKKWR